jgi:hypothetical protein
MELARSCSLLPGLAYGIALATLILATTDCASRESVATSQQAQYEAQRKRMVDLIASRGVRDSTTLRAMRGVRRHEFVPGELESSAYGDHPLPIGFGQTISQPYIVAYMTEVLRPRPGMKVLEVGTGSQCAAGDGTRPQWRELLGPSRIWRAVALLWEPKRSYGPKSPACTFRNGVPRPNECAASSHADVTSTVPRIGADCRPGEA